MDAKPRTRRVLQRLFVSLVVLAGTLCVVELGLRVYFARKVGRNVLFYGTPWHRREVSGKESATVGQHKNRVGAYTKYFPHQDLRDYDRETGESFAVTINSRGFRGAEWEDAKAPGIVRVVTLGASSTFGYSDRDGETYPVLLEAELERRDAEGRDFEVINLAVPHLESDQILALFVAEGVPLAPDVVTFYEGVNDASSQHAPVVAAARDREGRTRASLLRPWIEATREYLLLASFLDSRFPERVERFSAQDFAAHAGEISARFLANLGRIEQAAREAGAAFVPATQQAKSFLVPAGAMRGVSYAEEVERVRAELAQSGGLTAREFYFLTHDVLMRDLRAWAGEQRLPLVDGVAALDADRDVLVSWVHLNARGNALLARAFADTILEVLGR